MGDGGNGWHVLNSFGCWDLWRQTLGIHEDQARAQRAAFLQVQGSRH